MKSEKEKMLAGELYLASDPQLIEERRKARKLTGLYNSTSAEEIEKRIFLLRELLGKVGNKIEIEPPFYCDYGYNITAGENIYLNFGCVILDCNLVLIGDNVKIGSSVQIYSAYHPVDPALRNSGKELASPVSIGNNVWIGGGAIICPGVKIGNNSTVGAGSVVVKDIPDNVVVAGNPCRVIKSF